MKFFWQDQSFMFRIVSQIILKKFTDNAQQKNDFNGKTLFTKYVFVYIAMINPASLVDTVYMY